MTMRRFGSSAFTVRCVELPNISHSHCTCLPASSRPLLLVNQNFVVISGLTKASNTSATGLRMSIPVFAAGTRFSWRLSMLTPLRAHGQAHRPGLKRRESPVSCNARSGDLGVQTGYKCYRSCPFLRGTHSEAVD